MQEPQACRYRVGLAEDALKVLRVARRLNAEAVSALPRRSKGSATA
jgi:hypothetical protein